MKELYYNAEVITMDKYRTVADAILVEDAIIKKVGTKELLESENDTDKPELIDMEGRTILPGFIDGHSHLSAAAYDMMLANANPSPKGACDSLEELLSELRKQYEQRKGTLKEGEWFMAMGYDESVYPDHALPTKFDMDKVCNDRPMCCIHASGHNAVFNSKALELCQITSKTPIPEGGGMPKLPGSEEYSGLLQEAAFLQLAQKITTPGVDTMMDALKRCINLYASYGLTTVQDAKTGEKDIGVLQMADANGMLKQDVVCYIDFPYCEKYLPKQKPYKNTYNGHVRFAGYKLFLDGSPQAKTAWLTKPYHIPPEGKEEDYCGFPSMTEEQAVEHMITCLKNDWQINVHTNGDAAIDQFLTCYKKALEQYPEKTDLRPVFIHCQTVREDQLDVIKSHGMLISFFEDHVYYWGDYHYESVLGPERGKHISPLASALDRGINCTLHQDTPVVNPNVLFAVHNAVNRKTKKGRILGVEQRVSVYDALKAVTINCAYQIFEEKKKGSLEPGKIADLVVLDKNPLKVPPEEIKNIKVLQTIKNGESIYQAEC